MFPLGGKTKPEIRALAAEFDLPVAEKPDSQDICFVPQGRYARVVERLQPGAAEPGEIVDLEGRVLGRHEGVIHYTVGQRRGLGIAGAEPLYVVRLDAAGRRVVVGPKAALGCAGALLREINWLDGEAPAAEGLPVDRQAALGEPRRAGPAAARRARFVSPPPRPPWRPARLASSIATAACWAAASSPVPFRRRLREHHRARRDPAQAGRLAFPSWATR